MSKKLLEPIEIKGMRLKNRLGFAPMANKPLGEDGSVTDLTIRWYEERAKGGVGFVMTGAFGVTPPRGSRRELPATADRTRRGGATLYDDSYIPGFAKLAKAIHAHDVKLGIQIVGPGPISGQGPSAPPYPDGMHATYGGRDITAGQIVPNEVLTIEQIEQYQQDLVAATARAKAAGVDCVELHLAHTSANLVSSFVSPFFNRRTDKYGGDWAGRLRLPIETIKKMREVVGQDYPIFVRITADELLGKRGITIEDTVNIIVPALEEAGVDCIDVSQGSISHASQGITIPLYYPRGCFIHLAEAVKRATRLPVIGVGRIVDLDMAEKFVQEGKADIVFLSRQLTADPETPKKYFEGRPEDIRKCIGCLGGWCGRPCVINYDIEDRPIPLTQAEKKKSLLVIGGGVAGMEAARVAALRGHDVALIERDSQLGGAVASLALNPLLSEFGNIVEYLATQMRKLGVQVRVCKEVVAADVAELRPDVVILATGSSDVTPDVARGKPGVMTYFEACRRPMAVGHKVVIWGFFGAELAIALAEQGKEVTLIGKTGEGSLGSDLPGSRRFWLLRKLTDLNLARETPEAMRMYNPEVLYNVEVGQITSSGIEISDKEGRKKTLPYDTIIIAQRFGERKANDSVFNELQSKVPEIYKIGDCLQVRGIYEAIFTANEVARKI